MKISQLEKDVEYYKGKNDNQDEIFKRLLVVINNDCY